MQLAPFSKDLPVSHQGPSLAFLTNLQDSRSPHLAHLTQEMLCSRGQETVCEVNPIAYRFLHSRDQVLPWPIVEAIS